MTLSIINSKIKQAENLQVELLEAHNLLAVSKSSTKRTCVKCS